MTTQQLEKAMTERKLFDWGLSMYGGWYANLWIDGKYTGIHADTLKDLRKQLAELGLKTENWRRVDN